jgi:hypothetical protein
VDHVLVGAIGARPPCGPGVETIILMNGATMRIMHKALPTNDRKQRRPDITRARTPLHREPKALLDEGLVKTVDYFRRKIG